MRLSAWRIKKVRGKWHVLAPGTRFAYLSGCDTYADAVRLLAEAQRWAERGFR